MCVVCILLCNYRLHYLFGSVTPAAPLLSWLVEMSCPLTPHYVLFVALRVCVFVTGVAARHAGAGLRRPGGVLPSGTGAGATRRLGVFCWLLVRQERLRERN